MVSMCKSEEAFQFGWNFDFHLATFPFALTKSGDLGVVFRGGNPYLFDTSLLASTTRWQWVEHLIAVH